MPAYAYDTAQAIVRAYHKEQKVTTSSIRAILPFSGVTGEINLDADGDIMATVGLARINSEGKIENIPLDK